MEKIVKNPNNQEAPRTSFFSRYLAKPISYFIFIFWSIVTVAPLVWMTYSSFKSNEELTRDIYALPKAFFTETSENSYLSVVDPAPNMLFPKDYLKNIGVKTVKDIAGINKKVLILESDQIGGHKKIKVTYILRDTIPSDFQLSDGRYLRDIMPGPNVTVKASELPKNIQRKINWETIWWNYTSAWKQGGLGMKFINSIIYTVISTFLVVLLGLMLGYGTTKFKFKKTAAIIAAVVGLGYLLDINQLLVPLFLMLTKLKLTNTHLGIILVYTAFGLPMAVMLSSTYIKGLPYSLVESAYIDGASPFRTFISIIVPMTVPVIVTIGIMTALGIWNEFLLVLVFASSEVTKSLPVGVYSFSSKTGMQLGWQVAALIIATVPVLIVYFIFQKRLAEGVAGGAIKE